MMAEETGLQVLDSRRESSMSNMALRDLLSWAKDELADLGSEEALANAEGLLRELEGLDRTGLYLEADRVVPSDRMMKFKALVVKRKKRIPLSHLTGKVYFWNEILAVGPECLIPRPETEVLIEKFIECSGFGDHDPFKFLDLATGSGAISIALLRHYRLAQATVSDVSSEALAIAKENLQHYKLLDRVEIVQSDLFRSLKGNLWDAIVCNPPYLSQFELINTHLSGRNCDEPRLYRTGLCY